MQPPHAARAITGTGEYAFRRIGREGRADDPQRIGQQRQEHCTCSGAACPCALERIDASFERARIDEVIECLRLTVRNAERPQANHQLRAPALAHEHDRVVHTGSARGSFYIPAHRLQATAVFAGAQRNAEKEREDDTGDPGGDQHAIGSTASPPLPPLRDQPRRPERERGQKTDDEPGAEIEAVMPCHPHS